MLSQRCASKTIFTVKARASIEASSDIKTSRQVCVFYVVSIHGYVRIGPVCVVRLIHTDNNLDIGLSPRHRSKGRNQ